MTEATPAPAPQKSNGAVTCVIIGCLVVAVLCFCCSLVMVLFGNLTSEGECLYKGPLFSTTDTASPCYTSTSSTEFVD